ARPADPPDQLAAPAARQELPAQLPARNLARLALLGHRAGRIGARDLPLLDRHPALVSGPHRAALAELPGKHPLASRSGRLAALESIGRAGREMAPETSSG